MKTIGRLSQKKKIYIGVLARRGNQECLREWLPTAQYLTDQIPGTLFKIVPLAFEEVTPAVEDRKVDFIVVNSSIYVEMQVLYSVSRMATIKRITSDGYSTLFGGVIFCRSDRREIASLKDLNGKSFMAVDETSFGGWRVAWREFKKSGVNPYKDFGSLAFGGTDDDVIYVVRDKKVAAGTIATPILEQMVAEGKIAPDTFKVINRQNHADFPYACSTHIYPEWPFAKLKHTPDAMTEKVAIALLGMTVQSPAAEAAHCSGLIEAVGRWGEATSAGEVFSVDQCWALRRGEIHLAKGASSGLRCKHIPEDPPVEYMCVPMVAQGEITGHSQFESAGKSSSPGNR